MRAHSQRRVIWILDVVLGIALLGVLAWYFLDVRPALAKEAYVQPKFADAAVEEFNQPDEKARAAARPPVTKEMLAEIDKPTFMKDGERYHFAYSGPMPGPPPEAKREVRKRGPVQDDLAKLGRVVVMLYDPPDEGETVASGSKFYWEFSKTKNRRVIEVGEFLKESGDAPDEGIKIIDVRPKPAGSRRYEIVYEVYDDPNEPPVKQGAFLHDGAMKLSQEVEDRVKSAPGAAAVAEAEASAEQPAVREEGGVVTVGGGDAPEPAGSGSRASRIDPKVEWEGLNSARVEFDQGTFDYFRSGDADSLAASVKTQEARDPSGGVIGLEITGISSDTPADKFDIKPGDILVSIDDQPVKSRSDAINIAQRIDPDTKLVKVVVDRRGRLITFSIDPRDPKTRRRAATTIGRD